MLKKILNSSITTLVASVLAIGLIGYGGIHTVQAAPRVVSEYYGVQAQLANIDTAIVENGAIVEGPDALLQNWPANDTFAIGKAYDEALAVKNVGDASDGGIDEYVRVTVRTYWTDAEGKELKDTSLKPEYIRLHFVEGNGWSIDKKASTEERTVLYYSEILAPGETSAPFTDTLAISSEVTTAISGGGTFSYEGVDFHISVVADAVQTHNASDAMGSAWGVSR